MPMQDFKETLRTRINESKDDVAVGLSSNPNGVPFHCPTCEYFDDGHCGNKNPKLNGKKVGAQDCCNLYDHPGMKIVVK